MSINLCQFFTADRCSESLIAEVDAVDPAYVIDVGAGYGSLTRAAMHRWQSANVASLEIDPLALDVLQRNFPTAKQVRVDLLRSRLPKLLGNWLDCADVVLCNPPFREIDAPIADKWLAAAGMPTDWPKAIRCRSEMVFLAHNLRLLKSNGELAMILPAAFVNGHAFVPFRRWLLKTLTVTKVIQLPQLAFSKADVRAFAIIARKAPPPPCQRVRLLGVAGSASAFSIHSISPADGVERLDPAFHLEGRCSVDQMTLADLGVSVRRGTPVHELKALKRRYFHTNDFARYQPSSGVRLTGECFNADLPKVGAGDILVGRIGRSCFQQVLGVAEGYSHFSDCVYRVRVPKEAFTFVLKSMLDPRGVQWRASRLRGSAVALLSKSDLMEHPLRWEHLA